MAHPAVMALLGIQTPSSLLTTIMTKAGTPAATTDLYTQALKIGATPTLSVTGMIPTLTATSNREASQHLLQLILLMLVTQEDLFSTATTTDRT